MDITPNMRAPVSVIIPCYRCADTIKRAVHSVWSQTLLPQEIILIDDGSDDAETTLAAMVQLKSSSGNTPIRILSLEKNVGPAGARNAGWEASTQCYLAFLDADDAWHPGKLEAQYGWMQLHPNVALCGHISQKLAHESAMPMVPVHFSARRIKNSSLIFTNYFPTRTVMLKRDIPLRFPTEKRYAEDYLLWLSIVYAGYEAWLMNAPWAYSFKEEFGEGGLTANLWKAQQGVLDVYQQLHKKGRISCFLCITASIYSLLKYVRRWLLTKMRTRSTLG
jgi:glycosyltransferase involved in cell wall biosynthesis